MMNQAVLVGIFRAYGFSTQPRYNGDILHHFYMDIEEQGDKLRGPALRVPIFYPESMKDSVDSAGFSPGDTVGVKCSITKLANGSIVLLGTKLTFLSSSDTSNKEIEEEE